MFSANGLEEASIITEVKPPSMQALQVSKSGPWSRCSAMGISGQHDDSGLDQLDQIVVVGIGAGALGNLQNDRSVLFLAGFGDALNDFHVVDVESADGVAAVVSLLEHFGCSYQRHNDISLFYSNSIKDSSKFQ